jgi:hypothetical protein
MFPSRFLALIVAGTISLAIFASGQDRLWADEKPSEDATTDPADEPATEPPPSEPDTPPEPTAQAKAAKTPEELDPESRKKYDEARERLRQAEKAEAQAMLDAEAADPQLVASRLGDVKDRARLLDLSTRLANLERSYAERGEKRLKQFHDWKELYARKGADAYLKKLAGDPRKRPLVTWYATNMLKHLSLIVSNLSEQQAKLLPENADELKGEEALEAFMRFTEGSAESPKLAALEKSVEPSGQEKEVVWQSAAAEFDMQLHGAYLSSMTPPAVREAERKSTRARNDVATIWPYWAEYEQRLAEH